MRIAGCSVTPTARTMSALREAGYTPAVVERWLPRLNIRQDLFGCIERGLFDGRNLGAGDKRGSKQKVAELATVASTGDYEQPAADEQSVDPRIEAKTA
jgi:hypothetical protein